MGFPEERREEKLERAELLINLPRDWKLTKADCREEPVSYTHLDVYKRQE